MSLRAKRSNPVEIASSQAPRNDTFLHIISKMIHVSVFLSFSTMIKKYLTERFIIRYGK